MTSGIPLESGSGRVLSGFAGFRVRGLGLGVWGCIMAYQGVRAWGSGVSFTCNHEH